MADALKLDDILSCPVCYEVFKPNMKILQCRSGHAMCEKCHEKLQDCPICHEVLIGTRNFVMEEMVKKLRRLSTGALLSLDDDISPGTAPVHACMSESQSDSELEEISAADKKKEERKAKKKEKMKLKKQQKQSSQVINGLVIGEPSTSAASNQEAAPPATSQQVKRANNDTAKDLEVKRRKLQIRQTLAMKNPPQPSGLFPCPTNDKNNPNIQCQSKISFARLYNHLRSLHSDRLLVTEAIIDSNNLIARCELEIKVPVADYRHVVSVKEFGLFVLVFSAEREMTFGEECTVNRVTGFVKMVGTVSASKHYNYKLEVAIGKYVANCSDMCHHSFTDEASVLLTDQCLSLKVSKLSRFARVKLELIKNCGSRTRQPLTTDIQIIPNFGSTNHQGQSANQRKQHKKKKNKKH